MDTRRHVDVRAAVHEQRAASRAHVMTRPGRVGT